MGHQGGFVYRTWCETLIAEPLPNATHMGLQPNDGIISYLAGVQILMQTNMLQSAAMTDNLIWTASHHVAPPWTAIFTWTTGVKCYRDSSRKWRHPCSVMELQTRTDHWLFALGPVACGHWSVTQIEEASSHPACLIRQSPGLIIKLPVHLTRHQKVVRRIF